MRSAAPRPASAAPVVYPDSDGEPMAAVSELRVVVLHGALRVVRA